MNLRSMNPFEHGRRVARQSGYGDGWKDFKFPEAVKLPSKPWHNSDNDKAFRSDPKRKVLNSERIIDNLRRSGGFSFFTGSPEVGYLGNTEGVYLNKAVAGDPQFTIASDNGPRKLCVITGYAAPYGKKVRIPKDAVVQGYPMNEYSDHKLHIFDEVDNTITEIQFVVDVSVNPILSGLLNFFAMFGIGQGAGGLQCHGVSQYSLDLDSTDPKVSGSSAAKIPIVETTLRYDDMMSADPQMSHFIARSPKSVTFVPPARSSDGPGKDQHDITMGQVVKLSRDSYKRLFDLCIDSEVCLTIINSWYYFGMVCLDTAGHNATGLDIDARWPQDELLELKSQVSINDFEIWEM